MNAPEIIMPDRTTFIGGSDAASINEVSPWKTKFQLYQEKIGEYVEESDPKRDKILKRGKIWEPVVVEMLLEELKSRGHEVEVIGRNVRYVDPEFSFLQAEIDLELLVDGKEFNSEMKTTHPLAAKAWGEEGTDAIPVYYSAQAMHGMMIKPRPAAIVAVLIGADDLKVYELHRDDETIAVMRQRAVEFWHMVQTRTPPPITEPEDVKRMFWQDAGTTMEADERLADICRELKQKKEQLQALEQDAETLENALKLRMGDAATLIYGDKAIATWKTQQSRKVDTKALGTVHPEIVAAFLKTKESRVLRLK